MLRNLCAEMARHEVKTTDISKVIKKTDRSVRLKVAGANAFTMPEAIAIRDAFFSGLTLEYLFARTDTGQPQAQQENA